MATYVELLGGSSTWEEQVPSTTHLKNQGILARKLPGGEAPFEPAWVSICFPSSDLAMERGRKEKGKWLRMGASH
ncbi:unnamed protein product [Prunus armeniaca]